MRRGECEEVSRDVVAYEMIASHRYCGFLHCLL